MSAARIITVGALAAGVTLAALDAKAGTLTTLYSFTGGPDGGYPLGSLLYRNGTLYGTTDIGGTSMAGTIFVLNPATGAESVLFNFSSAIGENPSSGLLVHRGTFYGATNYGAGSNMNGAVYAFTPDSGTATTLYNFHGRANGKSPLGQLVYGNGMLYGTTRSGGTSDDGTVFSVNPKTGAETVIYSFASAIGVHPLALTFEGGMLYGIAGEGGPSAGDGFGTVFKVDPGTGAAAVVYAFTDGADGEGPTSLIYLDGSLYVTVSGEVTSNGTVVSSGVVASVNPQTGALTVLYSFPASGTDGSLPNSLSAHGGALYGTTNFGGLSVGSGCSGGCGTLFKVDLATGAEALLYKFPGGPEGAYPSGFAHQGGALYGTTFEAGLYEHGTVFKFAP